MAESYKVRIVNPARRRKPRKKKAPTMARNRKGQYIKKKRTRRRRRRNPATVTVRERVAAPRRRRRRRATNTKHRRRRRRNPENGGNGLTFKSIAKDLPWAIIGRLIQAYGVRQLGGAWGEGIGGGMPGAMGIGTATTSPYAGQPWSFRNYLTAMTSSWLGAQLIKRFKGAREAKIVWRSGMENVATRFVWTEIIGRSPQLQQMFGQTMLPGWITEGPMGGYGQLVEAGPMGQLVDAGPMGHYVGPADTPGATAAEYQGAGSDDPFQYVYDYRG